MGRIAGVSGFHGTVVSVMTWQGSRHGSPRRRTTTDTYTEVSNRVAADVIHGYSTSFSLATRLLPTPVRRDIRNLYAVVRIADEIVDGAAADAGATPEEVRGILDDYESRVLAATTDATTGATSFHTDPVLHAWAATAGRCGIEPSHMRSFFSSMRQDLDRSVHDAESLDHYIHGSAEVIGLMCLDIFLTHDAADISASDKQWLAEGAAALGRAFQVVNFLRDLAADHDGLGRIYLPELADGPLTVAARDRILGDIEDGLAQGRARIPFLPVGCRRSVAAAAALYADLASRIRATDPAELARTRIRVPAPRKLLVTARAVAQTRQAGRGNR